MAVAAGDDDVLAAVIRAGADGKDAGHVGAALDALRSPNSRLRLVAAWGLGRAGREDYADHVLPLLADPDPLVAHAAVTSLVAMGAADDCVRMIDDSYATLAPGAARVVQAFHRMDVVEMLSSRLGRAKDPAVRAAAYRALCRLAHREAPWDGGWWGTRPDTSGPYYKLAEWEGTPKVKELLRGALAAEKPEMLRTLILELKRHKIDLPEAGPVVAKLAADDPAFRRMMLDLLASKRDLSTDDVALVKPVAVSTSEAPATRAKAVRLLARRIDDDSAFETVVQVLAPVAAAESAAGDLRSALTDITRDPRLSRRVDAFIKLTESGDGARRELGYAVLLNLATSRGERGQGRSAARKAIDASWSDAGRAASLLRAIGGGRVETFKQTVAARRSDSRPEVAAAATAAAQRLGLSGQPAGPTIASLGYEKTFAAVKAAKGDPTKGAEVFGRLACANCHTVSAAEAPKGPFLGGIGTRYNRAELCESVLKPNAKIAQGFETQWFKPAKGDVVEGFVTRESGDEVELRNVQGDTLVLKKAAVERRGKRDFSTMPEGLAANLTAEELADLLAYVESLKGK
jgi:putative heme-binding domain-containing protein